MGLGEAPESQLLAVELVIPFLCIAEAQLCTRGLLGFEKSSCMLSSHRPEKSNYWDT